MVCSTALAMPEAGEGRRAEVADHGGVGEQEQRLGDERAERGDGEAQDLAIDGAAAEDADRLDPIEPAAAQRRRRCRPPPRAACSPHRCALLASVTRLSGQFGAPRSIRAERVKIHKFVKTA